MVTRGADRADLTAAADPVTCAWCGIAVSEVPLTWMTSTERGRLLHYCDRCSREHLRSIEGKLDTDFW